MLKDSNEKKIKLLKEQISLVSIINNKLFSLDNYQHNIKEIMNPHGDIVLMQHLPTP